MHQVIDDERAERDLGADVQEDARRTEAKTRLPQQIERVPEGDGLELGFHQSMALQPHQCGHQYQRGGQPEIGANDHRRLVGAKRIQCRT